MILGHNGMLGGMVFKQFTKLGYNIKTTNNRWPDNDFLQLIKNSQCEFLINCIGVIPQKSPNLEKLYSVNTILPIWLAKNFNGKILHPTTDCEFSGKISVGEFYDKSSEKDASTDYGISKLSSSYLLTRYCNVKQLRTSIIGPEFNGNKVSLLEWFLKQKGIVNGYKNHYWNGITTYQWSLLTHQIISNWDNFDNVIQVSTECVSKYELLNIINDEYKTNKLINAVEDTYINRCLKNDGQFTNIPDIRMQLKEYISL